MRMNVAADMAVELLLGQEAKKYTETLRLWELEGRILAEDIRAAISVPPFDRSPYDGYALMAADTAGASREAPAVLKITEEIPAGHAPTILLTPGHAAKILTGAPIPEGCDATIKYEDTEFTDTEVRIFAPQEAGSNVVRAGEDIKAGEVILTAGTLVSAAALGILAGQGISEATVYKKPRIAVISTGSELAEAGKPLKPAQIYNSNVYTLSAYLRAMGAEPVNGGIVPDDPDAISARISEALETSDMIITTGGASVGDYDWAYRVSEMMGAEILFWKADFKPGGAMCAAVLNGKLILCLSGNPGAAVIGLLRVGMPYVRKLCGHRTVMHERLNVIMKDSFGKKSPRLRLVRGRLEIKDGVAYFVHSDGQGNGVISSLMGCDLLAEIPAGTGRVQDGQILSAIRVPSN
ncbi:MAG: molybdopterin molybdotransferase MoeA [Clostridiales bacterium]|nr:molybdopterin molybdotransferase MoeA [Clostridiales bacterium]